MILQLKVVFIYVYDALGKLYKKHETKDMNGASLSANFELPKGDYKATIIAFNDEKGEITSSIDQLNSAYLYKYNKGVVQYYNDDIHWISIEYENFDNTFYNDYFAKNVEFIVRDNEELNIVAPRVTGRVVFNFKDIEKTTNPNNTFAYVRIKLENFPYGVNFSNLSAYSNGINNNYIYLTKKQWEEFADRPMIINVMPTSTPRILFEFSSSFSGSYGDFFNPITNQTLEFKDFEVFENRRTVFTGSASKGFKVEINTKWGEDNNHEF